MSNRSYGCFTIFGSIESATRFIFGFPPAGGNPSGTFLSWEPYLPPGVCVLGYCPPGRGLRSQTAVWTTFDEVIKEIVAGILDFFLTQEFSDPSQLILYGHSLGSLFAFHTALYLEENPIFAETIPIPCHLVCAGKNAPINQGFTLPSSQEIGRAHV